MRIIPGFPYIKRPSVKPDIWGPPTDVEDAVKDWCENKLGTSAPILATPFWVGAGIGIYDYSGYAKYLTAHAGIWSYGAANNQSPRRLSLKSASSAYVSTDNIHADNITYVSRYRSRHSTISSPGVILAVGGVWSTSDNKRSFTTYWVNEAGTIKIIFSTSTTGSNINDAKYACGINTGFFTHAGTWDGTDIKLYEDGVKVAENTTVAATGNIYSSDAPLFLSAHRVSGSPDRFFGCERDCEYIFPEALTQEQIALIYEQPFAMFEPVSRPKYFDVSGGSPPATVQPIVFVCT